MTLFSYVVARDFGFAPNPFGGFCTLATCKPEIRRLAQIGDWVAGTGSASRDRKGHIVYAMKVAEAMTFNEYWNDVRFGHKKPNMQSSKKIAFGDNIYRFVNGDWLQENSHHSFADGTKNVRNVLNDTKADRILIATEFAYWGGTGPKIPDALRNFQGHDICIGRGYKRNFPEGMADELASWLQSQHAQGYLGRPLDWG